MIIKKNSYLNIYIQNNYKIKYKTKNKEQYKIL